MKKEIVSKSFGLIIKEAFSPRAMTGGVPSQCPSLWCPLRWLGLQVTFVQL